MKATTAKKPRNRDREALRRVTTLANEQGSTIRRLRTALEHIESLTSGGADPMIHSIAEKALSPTSASRGGDDG